MVKRKKDIETCGWLWNNMSRKIRSTPPGRHTYKMWLRMLQDIELKCNNHNRFYHILTTFNKLNKTCHTIVEWGKSIPITHKYTQIHNGSISCLDIHVCPSIKSDKVKLAIWAQTSPLCEMMRSFKCVLHVSKCKC